MTSLVSAPGRQVSVPTVKPAYVIDPDLPPQRAIACPADADRRLVIDEDGTDADELLVTPITFKVAAEAVVTHHYMHRKPAMSFAYGIVDHGKNLRAAITYGTPASRHLQIGICPTDPGKVLELNRMWLADDLPHGLASWFISRTLRRLPGRIVCSYADTIQGHMGWVYRAANFHYAGWTDMERKTARYDYIPLQAGAHTREAFRSGFGQRVRRKPKVKYWTVTGTPTDRKVLSKACEWPILDWREYPPPVEHQHLRLGK